MVAEKAEREAGPVPGEAKTWRDFLPPWMGEPKLITRAEVLEVTSQLVGTISERTLRYWEMAGVLPRPVRQSHQGVVQAVYPDWFPLLVAAAYWARQRGRSVPELVAAVPSAVQNVVLMRWVIENKVMPLGEAPEGQPLIPHLPELARTFSSPDNPITRVTITLADSRGETAVNLLWLVPPESLSDGEVTSSPSDSLLSDGLSKPAPSDSTCAK